MKRLFFALFLLVNGGALVALAQDFNPRYANPGYDNPRYANPGYANPRYANPGYANPGYANPGYANPGYANPGYANPGSVSPSYTSSYQELARPANGAQNDEDAVQSSVHVDYSSPAFNRVALKPTQAYYMPGYTIYYGYQAIPVTQFQENTMYAFGYPVAYFRHLLPDKVDSVDLSRYATQAPRNDYDKDEYADRTPASTNMMHEAAVSRVEPTIVRPAVVTVRQSSHTVIYRTDSVDVLPPIEGTEQLAPIAEPPPAIAEPPPAVSSGKSLPTIPGKQMHEQ